MKMLKIGSLFSLVVCLLSFAAFAADQPSITVVVQPNPTVESETVQLRIQVVSRGSEQVARPEFEAPDFTFVGSSVAAQTSSVYDNGKITMEKSVIYTMLLMPKKTGILNIGKIRAKVGDQYYTHPDMRVKVDADGSGSSSRRQRNTNPGINPVPNDEDEDSSNPAAPGNFQSKNGGVIPNNPKGGGDLPASFNSDFTVHGVINKRSAYVGEPITIEYYLYDFGGIRQVDVQKWPTFTGFWKEDLQMISRFEFDDIYVKNQPMRRAFISKYALYGIKPGKFNIDKLVVRAGYASRAFFGDDDDPFSNFLGAVGPLKTASHASQDIAVEILPLPEAGRPQNFSGAVGQFSLNLEADKTSVPANTPLTLSINVEGSGNFQAIDNFKLPLPPDFELYESNTNGRPAVSRGAKQSLQSKKTFQYIVIPRKSGAFKIPAVSWSYFNPEKRSYETLSTKELEINVTENANAAADNNTYLKKSSDTSSAPTTKTVEDFRYVKTLDGTEKPSKTYWNTILIILGLINLGLAGIYFSSRKTKFALPTIGDESFKKAREELKILKANKPKNWQSDLEEALHLIIEALVKTNPRGLTRGELHEIWTNMQLPESLFERIQNLLNRLDQQRFSASAQKSDFLQIGLADAEEILKIAIKIKRK